MSDLNAIRRRWSTHHDRGADDYTDEGCRVLAEHAFRDVAALLGRVESEQQRLREAHAYMSWLVDQLCDDHDLDCARNGCPASPSDIGLPSNAEQPLQPSEDRP